MKPEIQVAIVEDNTFLPKTIKERLSVFPDIEVVLHAANGSDLLEKIKSNNQIDVVLMDIEMPIMNGIQATELLKQKFPHIKVIMLTVFDNDENIFNSIKVGADGYLLKEVPPKELYDGIIDTLSGGAAMTPSIAAKTLKLLRNPNIINSQEQIEEIILSTREIEVLEQLSKGLNYKNIATNLFVSPHTIRKHIENIYNKLQVHNKIEAIEKAKHKNII